MKLPKLNSFIVGFLSPIILVAIYWAANLEFVGGHNDVSPSGRYHLHIIAPESPRRGGAYSLELTRKVDDAPLRKIKVALPGAESTIRLRAGHAAFEWDVAETYADVSVDGNRLIRIYVPKDQSAR